jgi:hypothetical protein
MSIDNRASSSRSFNLLSQREISGFYGGFFSTCEYYRIIVVFLIRSTNFDREQLDPSAVPLKPILYTADHIPVSSSFIPSLNVISSQCITRDQHGKGPLRRDCYSTFNRADRRRRVLNLYFLIKVSHFH